MASIEAAATADGLVECWIGAADVEAAVPLAEEAGWNQVAADWRLMLAHGSGVGMRDGSGRLVATALTFRLGARLSWISMVLTVKAWRHRGIGTRLLERCVALVRESGAVAGLDATELGRPIYAALGFKELYHLSRWHLPRAPSDLSPTAGVTIRPASARDLPDIAEYDAPRSALDRRHVLSHLLARAPRLAHVAESRGRLQGFVLGRDGRIATQLGPIVAESEAIAIALLARASRAGDSPFILDVPDRHAAMTQHLRAAGATSPRGFFRMTLGDAPGLDDARRVMALAGPELA
ncbi:MAG: GNAT family N-acetyltransferase [Alphaproteobacteria bacterium]|nr:GNAT family N-acetyltransferase [Alphaproteobacteria bacterium]